LFSTLGGAGGAGFIKWGAAVREFGFLVQCLGWLAGGSFVFSSRVSVVRGRARID